MTKEMNEKRDFETEGAIPEAADLATESKEVDGNVEDVQVAEVSLESQQLQIDRLEADVAHLKAQAGVPRVRTQAEVDALLKEQKAVASLSAGQKTEKEIRRYVKRDGGYRRDVTKSQKAYTGRLLKKLGRKTPTWDTDLLRG